MTAKKYTASPGPKHDPSRSAKRVLWEVRQRYQLGNAAKARPAAPTVRPSVRRPEAARGAAPVRRAVRAGAGKTHWGRRIGWLVFLLVVASGGVFGYRILAAGNKISAADTSFLGQLRDLLFSSGEFLDGEQDGRINVLLAAIGGEGHKGENLADTIMVASLRPQTNEAALLSIPRDLYVQVPGEDYYSKLNAVHAYGETQKRDGGPEILRQEIETITGLPIHYYIRVDFTAFKSIVDAVGGIDVTIDNNFFDYWHKIDFQAGNEKMNGERALAYVRARYIEGPEGGDFKRAERQQEALLAMREKVFSVNTAFDFRAVNAILNSLSDNIRTDMQLWEMKRFYEIARLFDQRNIRSAVLTTGQKGVLTGTTEVLGGVPASVLRPRTGDYSEIQTLAANIFSDDVSTTAAPTQHPPETPTVEEPADSQAEAATPKPTLEIRNGTNVTGLAAKTQETLAGKGYEVVAIGNAANRETAKTTVYALSESAADGAKAVAQALGAAADSGLPEGEAATDADVLIILGTDAQ